MTSPNPTPLAILIFYVVRILWKKFYPLTKVWFTETEAGKRTSSILTPVLSGGVIVAVLAGPMFG